MQPGLLACGIQLHPPLHSPESLLTLLHVLWPHPPDTPPPGVLALLPSPTGSSGRLASAPGITTAQLRGHASQRPALRSPALGLSVPLASWTSFFIVLTCSEMTLFINWPSCLLIGISEYKLLEGRHLVFSAHFVFPAPGLVHSRHSVNID